VKSCFPNGPLLFNRPGYEVFSWVGNFVGYILLNITVDVKSRSLYSLLHTYVFAVPQIHCHVQCYSAQVTKYKVLAGGLLVLWPNSSIQQTASTVVYPHIEDLPCTIYMDIRYNVVAAILQLTS
jgi:hypothetical protein